MSQEREPNWIISEKFEQAASGKPKPRKKDIPAFMADLVIEHKGHQVRGALEIPVPVKQTVKITVTFHEVNAGWDQALTLDTNGHLLCNGVKSQEGVELWTKTAPPEVTLDCNSKNGKLWVWNTWSTGPRITHSMINCSGIITVQKADNEWELYCNDGFPDDDFDDLIVGISITEPA